MLDRLLVAGELLWNGVQSLHQYTVGRKNLVSVVEENYREWIGYGSAIQTSICQLYLHYMDENRI
jgi:hypothetical protein